MQRCLQLQPQQHMPQMHSLLLTVGADGDVTTKPLQLLLPAKCLLVFQEADSSSGLCLHLLLFLLLLAVCFRLL